jgi:hypothetical protein
LGQGSRRAGKIVRRWRRFSFFWKIGPPHIEPGRQSENCRSRARTLGESESFRQIASVTSALK